MVEVYIKRTHILSHQVIPPEGWCRLRLFFFGRVRLSAYSQHIIPWRIDSSPLRIGHPQKESSLPSIIFQGWAAKLQGCILLKWWYFFRGTSLHWMVGPMQLHQGGSDPTRRTSCSDVAYEAPNGVGPNVLRDAGVTSDPWGASCSERRRWASKDALPSHGISKTDLVLKNWWCEDLRNFI